MSLNTISVASNTLRPSSRMVAPEDAPYRACTQGRFRSLVILSPCIALNRPNKIRVYLRGALRNGIGKAELRELCLHSFLYCGGPASLDALHVIQEALPGLVDEFLAEQRKKR